RGLSEGRERRRRRRARRWVVEHSWLTAPESHVMRLPVSVYPYVEPLAQGVDNGGADPVEPPGRHVAPSPELAARVKLRHDDLDAGQACLGFEVDGDSASGVAHLDRVVATQ